MLILVMLGETVESVSGWPRALGPLSGFPVGRLRAPIRLHILL